MNKGIVAAGVVISIALAYASLFTVPYAFGAILLGIPLMVLNRRYSVIAGLIIGLGSAFSIYLFYPVSSVSQLAGIVQQIIGIPSAALIVLFPMMFGLIGAVSALLFTGMRENILMRPNPKGESGKE